MRQNSKFMGALKKFGMLLVNMNTSNQKQSNLGNTYVFLNRNHLIKIVDYSQVPIKRVGPNKRVGWIFSKYFCLSLCLFLSSCYFGA